MKRKDSKMLLSLLAIVELMAAVVLVTWAALAVMLGLLVAAVQIAHRGLADPSVPLIRSRTRRRP